MKKKVILGLLILIFLVSIVYASGSCREDFNGDGKIDFADFTLFASAYNSEIGESNYDAKFDLDEEKGRIGIGDFLIFAESYDKKCEMERPRLARPAVLVGDFNGDGCVGELDRDVANKDISDWIFEIKNAGAVFCDLKEEVADIFCRKQGLRNAISFDTVTLGPYQAGGTIYLPGEEYCPTCKSYFRSITCDDGAVFSSPKVNGKKIDTCYKSKTDANEFIRNEAERKGDSVFLQKYSKIYDSDFQVRFENLVSKYNLKRSELILWSSGDQDEFEKHLGEGDCEGVAVSGVSESSYVAICNGYVGLDRDKCFIYIAAKPAVLDEGLCDNINQADLVSICKQKVGIGKEGLGV